MNNHTKEMEGKTGKCFISDEQDLISSSKGSIQ
jgi:hypothetical protein